jgi:hypothetical protein
MSDVIINKKLWEKIMAYFPFTTIWAFDTSKNLTCINNEVSRIVIDIRKLDYYVT